MECTICSLDFCTHPSRSIRASNGIWKWTCLDCGFQEEGLEPCNYCIAMYEGKVVNPNLTKEWGGYVVCKPCYEKFTL